MTDCDQPDDDEADHGADLPGADGMAIPYTRAAVFGLEADCGTQVEDFIRRRLRDDPDTIKVVERVWIDLLRQWQDKGELVCPRALLFRLAHHRCTDRLRQQTRRHEVGVDDPELLDEAVGALMARPEFLDSLVARLDVRAALAELPVRQQQALLFVFGYRLARQDAASLMCCSVRNVGTLLSKGTAAMTRSRHLSGYRTPARPEVRR